MDRPLRRFNRDGEHFLRRDREEQDSIARIAQAKRTAERAGYEVEIARPRIERPYRRSAQTSVVQDAMDTAREAGYSVRKMSPLQQAAQTVKDAGYEIKRMSPLQQAAQVAKNAGYSVRKDEPEFSHEERQENNYVSRAAHFLTRDED